MQGASRSSPAIVQVEVLGFAGCPNVDPALRLVERLVAELELPARVVCIEVENADAALTLRFLGSPSIRVNGRDVEPGADQRGEYPYSCRIYRTSSGAAGVPDVDWVRRALDSAGWPGSS